MRVEPSWRFWVVAAALIGLVVAGVCAGYLLATGLYRDLRFGSPDVDTWLVHVPSACIGRWGTVFVSGALFGLVHFAYGNAEPDNFVAGYFFAWAYPPSI